MRRTPAFAVLCLALILIVLSSVSGSAKVIYVKWNSPGAGSPATYDGTSWNTAFHTVGSGIYVASIGDEVWVASGTYKEHISLKDGVALYGGFAGTETTRTQRDFRNRLSRLVGVSAYAVVNCSPWPYTMLFRARLDGFRIESDTGITNTAISISSSGRAIIANNTIMTNKPSGGMGAISCYGSDVLIVGNTISVAGYYGVYCYKCSPVVMNNIFANYSGGGVYCELASPIIANNTMSSSYSAGVSGVYCVSSSPVISNNIIISNTNGIYVQKTIYPNIPSSPILSHNCAYGNGNNYYQIQPGASDMQRDPAFIWGNTHIRTTSPCVDAGDDSALAFYNTDMDGQPRLQGAHVDIGADETDGTVGLLPAGVVTVTPDGDDAADGTSWLTAKRTVQAAINLAPTNSEVWVSTGVYPERITLKEGTRVYGGFSGFEMTRDQRNWSKYATILDGNKLGPVVMSPQGLTANTRLDGFTIRCGVGLKNYENHSFGGGVYCDHSSPSLVNNTITDNSADAGAGIYCLNSSATIQSNNISRNSGHGIYCDSSSPRILGNRISGNVVMSVYNPRGGGITCNGESSPTIASNMISGNSALMGGGAISCGSGTIANNTITLNSTGFGGAVKCSSLTIMTNNIIAFNSSGIQAVSNNNQGPVLRRNCLYANGTSNYTGWAINEHEDRQNIYSDPLLASVGLGNAHLQPDSPCIDVGDSSAVEVGWSDVDGQTRIIGPLVDIGADESDGTSWAATPIIVRVKTDGDDNNDGSTWALAKKTVQAGIESVFARGTGEVWVMAGTYQERISLRAYVHVYGGFNGMESSRLLADPKTNTTVLDGQQLGCVVTSKEAGYRATTFDGFTITNGKGNSATWMDAGGIYCYKSSPLVSRNNISNNTGYGSGGGIELVYASPDIIQNSITGNNPCGIDCYQSSPFTSRNFIANNQSAGLSGMYASPVITDNVFASNTSGGVQTTNGSPTIRSNSFVGNHGGSGAISYSSYGNSPITVANNIVAFNYAGISVSSGVVLRNNCVFGNTMYNAVGAEPTNSGISADPLFVNKTAGDYHLLPGSPCIDKGTSDGISATDKDGMPRSLDGNGDGVTAPDMGAYESLGDLAYAKRSLPDGTTIGLAGVPVTATTPSMYVENSARNMGIRVSAGNGIAEGQIVNVFGTIQTDTTTGERYVAPASGWPKSVAGTAIIKPLALNNSDIGGGDAGIQLGVWSRNLVKNQNGQFQLQWVASDRLNTIGLLITSWGSVNYCGTDYFYIDDGSALDDESGHKGTKVFAAGLDFPSTGFVRVTGISSCEKNSEGKMIRVLKVRKQSDIVQCTP